MDSVCFFARSKQNKMYALAGKLMEDKYNVFYLTYNEDEEKHLINSGCKGKIYVITRFLRENWENETLLKQYSSYEHIEDKYQISSLWQLLYTDRFLINYEYAEASKFISLHVALFEKILTEKKPSLFINEAIAIFSASLFYEMGKAAGCKYIGFKGSPYGTGKYSFITNKPDHRDYLQNKLYENFDGIYHPEVDNVLDLYRKKNYKPAYMQIAGQAPRLNYKFPYYFLKFLLKQVKTVPIWDYEKYTLKREAAIASTKNYFKYNFVHKKYYNEPDYKDNYILFPLHFQPEATTLVCAPMFEKQLFAIDFLAKNIPGKYKLYVKEHYSFLGHRQNSFYRALKNYPNVLLINPFEDSHKLIKGSNGSVVLTSTVGWESIIWKKPVVILGEVWYDNFKYACRIKDLNTFTATFKNYIKEFEKIDDAEYELELKKFITAHLSSLVKVNYYLRLEDKVIQDDNIRELCGVIENELIKA